MELARSPMPRPGGQRGKRLVEKGLQGAGAGVETTRPGRSGQEWGGACTEDAGSREGSMCGGSMAGAGYVCDVTA